MGSSYPEDGENGEYSPEKRLLSDTDELPQVLIPGVTWHGNRKEGGEGNWQGDEPPHAPRDSSDNIAGTYGPKSRGLIVFFRQLSHNRAAVNNRQVFNVMRVGRKPCALVADWEQFPDRTVLSRSPEQGAVTFGKNLFLRGDGTGRWVVSLYGQVIRRGGGSSVHFIQI